MRYFKNPFKDEVSVAFDRKFWAEFLVEKVDQILQHVPCHRSTASGSLYTGSPGIAYSLWYLARTCADDVFTKEQRQQLRDQGYKYCESYFQTHRHDDPDTAFLCGGAGVHVVAALLAHDLGRTDLSQKHVAAFRAIGPHLQPVSFFRHGSDEMLVGRAGYLAGALQLHRFVPDSLDHHTIRALYESMIASGTAYAAHHRSASPLMYAYYGTEYLGAAHGLSGILQELLSCNGVVQGVTEPPVVRAAVDYMLSLKQADGNYAPAMDEVARPRRKEDALVHWCHGAPGVVYCMAMAYRCYGDAKYLNSIFEASDLVWERGLLRKGPGTCHGVAGSGYVHLLCYRLASSSEEKAKYLNRARRFCDFMGSEEFRKGARTPDCPWSLYEGWAGTVCFISDLLSNPDKAEFPFSDVFSF